MYKHLFFDLDNTIWDFDLNSYHALREVYDQYGLSDGEYEQFNQVYNRNNDHLWELYRKHEITKADLAASRFSLTFEELGIAKIDGAEFNHHYLERMPHQTRLCKGARELLDQLAPSFTMHIITNGFVEVQHKKMANSDLEKYFAHVFISEELKSPKPAPEIYHHALKTSNARKKESLMIGDSWDVDILGAMGVGIDQVHFVHTGGTTEFTDDEQTQIMQSPTRTWRFNQLAKIPGILRKY
ncbi:MAG TPA: noncanonical pyrimidine nucleotidase, YjjG family [Prolixibacteraceae bacterium]|nr:noncanonical pyrimidine nucleotidase, YjjG family [Prolixibacteraceae bacterium]